MQKFIKIVKLSFLLFINIAILTTVIVAKEPSEMIMDSISNELDTFKNSLPNEVLEFLPSEIWDGEFSKLLNDEFNESNLMSLILDFLFVGLNSALKSFSSILIILIISSIFYTLSNSFSSNSIKNSFNIASSICVSILIFNLCTSLSNNTQNYINGICKVMECFAPLMTSLYILTGNVTSGGIASASLILFISIVEKFLVLFMLPIINICMCFSIIKTLGAYFDLSGLSKILKNTFTGVTVFVMSVFMFVLSCKSILSQSADSISIKTAKFAISSFIPIVGGTVNDALRTVTSSISLIKNSCGIIAIIVIAILILPSIISLLIHRLLFNLTSSIAKCLKCNNEAVILDEATSICGFLLALVLCTCILFIFALTILIKTTVVT